MYTIIVEYTSIAMYTIIVKYTNLVNIHRRINRSTIGKKLAMIVTPPSYSRTPHVTRSL